MNGSRMGTWLIAAALLAGVPAMGLVGCGPEEGTETEIEVSTTETGGDKPDTVVHETTVVTPPADTVTNTIVQQRTDTVVKVLPGKTDTVRGSSTPSATTVSASERGKIDAWLRAHSDSLNQYGDPIGTAYTGGTPLFNESTGETISKYDYIVRQHPDRPWMQPSSSVSQPRR